MFQGYLQYSNVCTTLWLTIQNVFVFYFRHTHELLYSTKPTEEIEGPRTSGWVHSGGCSYIETIG